MEFMIVGASLNSDKLSLLEQGFDICVNKRFRLEKFWIYPSVEHVPIISQD